MNANDIKEMLENWNKAEAAVLAAFPQATAEDIYQMTSAEMKRSLGI